MNVGPFRNRKNVVTSSRALAGGVLVATVLVTGYTLLEAILAERAAGGDMLAPPASQALVALLLAPAVGLLLVICCTPIWLLLKTARLDGPYAAVILGFLAVTTYWTLNVLEAGSLPEHVGSGFAYSLCGAAAGFATWRASSRSRS